MFSVMSAKYSPQNDDENFIIIPCKQLPIWIHQSIEQIEHYTDDLNESVEKKWNKP